MEAIKLWKLRLQAGTIFRARDETRYFRMAPSPAFVLYRVREIDRLLQLGLDFENPKWNMSLLQPLHPELPPPYYDYRMLPARKLPDPTLFDSSDAANYSGHPIRAVSEGFESDVHRLRRNYSTLISLEHDNYSFCHGNGRQMDS